MRQGETHTYIIYVRSCNNYCAGRFSFLFLIIVRERFLIFHGGSVRYDCARGKTGKIQKKKECTIIITIFINHYDYYGYY